LEANALPISSELVAWQPESALSLALTGGDDYELCFTAPSSAAQDIQLITQTLHLPCVKVGTIVDSGFTINGYNGDLRGWQHF